MTAFAENAANVSHATGFRRPLRPDEQRLADAAKHASEEAIREAFAAGLSITIVRDGWIVKVAPDGTETRIRKLWDD